LIGSLSGATRARLKRGLRWTLAIVLLGMIAAHVVDNYGDYADTAASIAWTDLLILAGLQLCSLAIHSLRTQVIVGRLTRQPLFFFPWFRIFLVGRMLNTFMLQAGNIYRAYETKRLYQVSYTQYVAAYLVFIWVDMILNIAFVCAILAWDKWAGAATTAAHGEVFAIALLSLVALILAAPIATFVARLLLSIGSFLPKPRRLLFEMSARFWILMRDPGMILRFVSLGFVSIALLLILFSAAFGAIAVDIGLWQIAIIIAIYKLSLMVVITPGNIGIREWALVGACALFGVEATGAMTVALVTRATYMIGLLAAGVPALLAPHPRQDAGAGPADRAGRGLEPASRPTGPDA
jgi:uncharacterized membrane protein YbhN (UPF0104 family)